MAGKALPGLKYINRDDDSEHALAELIKHKMIHQYSRKHISSILGEFNYLGKVYENNGIRDPVTGNWIFQDPSMTQVKQNLIVRQYITCLSLLNTIVYDL